MNTKHEDSAKSFSDCTAGLFNIAKILALVGAALWTIYQWNETIFPKESFDEFTRRASRRTDLHIELPSITFAYIDELFNMNSTEAPVIMDGTVSGEDLQKAPLSRTLYIVGQCSIANEKDFPIVLQVGTMYAKSGRPIEDTASQSIKEDTAMNEINWFSHLEINPTKAFGNDSLKDGIVIEPRGTVILPIFLILTVNWKPMELNRFMELGFQASIAAVYPTTGERIEGSDKKKHISYRAIINRLYADDSMSPSLGIASRFVAG